MKTTKTQKSLSAQEKFLQASIKNLRESLNPMSMEEFVAKTVEYLMLIERAEYLEKAEFDKGNGFYERMFKSFAKNRLIINVPRTRKNKFTPATLELAKIGQEQIEELSLSLYKKGLSGKDIQEVINDMFGNKISASKINQLAKTFKKAIDTWKSSKLEKHYKVVFADVLFVVVRRGNSYSKEAVYVAYGVRDDNKRELLILDTNPTESASMWGEFFKELKKRGVEKIDLVVADGIKGLENEILGIFPEAEFQKCVVHKEREILKRARPKDKAEMAEDLKHVFDNFESVSSIDNALKKVDDFIQKWKPLYPNIDRFFKNGLEYYFTYIKFDPKVRRLIYTSNSVENINRAIRKATKNKLSFESPENMLRYIFMVVKEFEEKNFMKYPVSVYKYFRKIHD